MCSFLVTNWLLTNLTYVNFFMQPRGPDRTSRLDVRGFAFVHNLLHMTGEQTPQPFADPRGDVVAVYNGEIYNYEALAGPGDRWRSDGEALLPTYARHGVAFPRLLDGEFALAVLDFRRRRAILATDTFSTKPLWFSTHEGLHISSYSSGLVRLGIPAEEIHMADPNTILVVDLSVQPFRITERHAVHEFDLRQFKPHTQDFQAAFERAVKKRIQYAIHPMFIGLSSGYDSGAIQVALVKENVSHFAYTIHSTEDMETLHDRIAWAAPLAETNVIVLSGRDLEREANRLAVLCEPFHYRAARGQELLVSEDPASFGLSYIFREVRKRGILVYLSGTGADEIISDYGHGGKRIFPHSNFGGLFPGDLAGLFPWPAFFLGTQRDYLMKEELVAGAHGIEARYPFLDAQVVQEFLWLGAEVKNSKYKAPVHDWLARFGYPFRSGEKLGFNAAHNVRWEHGESLVQTYHAREVGEQPAARASETGSPKHGRQEDNTQHRCGDAAAPDTSAEAGRTRMVGSSLDAALTAEAAAARATELSAREEELRLKEERLSAAERRLAEQTAAVNRKVDELSAAQQYVAERESALDKNWRLLQEQAAHIQEQQSSQAEAYLRFMALRLVPIQHAAAASSTAAFFKTPLAAPGTPEASPSVEEFDTGHPRWSGVEVLTCVSGGRYLNVMDFPVYHIFRASTPLPVHNVCENIEWEGMHMRLRMYRAFLEERMANRLEQGRERLFIVSDGMDVIFNDLTELIASEPDLSSLGAAAASALLVIRRYEAVAGSATPGRAVFSAERLCGWGGGHMCSDEDEARYPQAPTDSKYLNAGSYIGPAAVLHGIIGSVLDMVALAKRDASPRGLRAKTTAVDAAGGETDQYFFKLHFWQHPESVTLDYHQVIFGNFLEVERSPCYDGWRPRCAFEPCCTVSDSFRRFNEVFYGSYDVRGCSIWRNGTLPISWHGNGAGKWLWLLSLEELSRRCAYVANLTVERYPTEPIHSLFDSFDVGRTLRQSAHGGN